ncbi:hypothetical protein SDC9_184216 [bioreactor metagenome]|uniref:Uncharacterized protein n=1 Tax=bioreactor metagenome TaxID=1076179 RepID=A0A645HDV0_9ZZZZ
MVGAHHLDLHALALGLQAVFHGHLRSHHRARAAHAGVGAGHVGQHADLDHVAGNLGLGGGAEREHSQGQRMSDESHEMSPWCFAGLMAHAMPTGTLIGTSAYGYGF